MIQQKLGITKNSIDYVTILIYMALALMGWLSIYAAVYNSENNSAFDITQRYGMQLLWIGISFFVAFVIILSDNKYYHMFSYPLYWLMLLVMLSTIFLGKEVNGAKSWFSLGPVSLQPVEFMKIATALALARFMSSYNFDLMKPRSLWYIFLIIGIPIGIIILQNDTGSALVFLSFFFVLYREGFPKMLYVVAILAIFLFIISFLLEPLAIITLLFFMLVGWFAVFNRRYIETFRFVAIVGMMFGLVVGTGLLFDFKLDVYYMFLIAVFLSLPFVGFWTYATHNFSVWKFVALFFASIIFIDIVDYVFDNFLQLHQQKRILDLLGLENDPKGWSYNVNQSMIAIGSGGFFGKGFLQGTQTKFSFVPEQSTDFIFCTVGEEWGFVGTCIVVVLFAVLIFRLMKMGERQKEPFGRIYCYSVAAILFVHFLINVGMTIGLFPVVGIPLPFFSYGGSSLLAFTILLFIAIRLDSSQEVR